MEIESLFDFTLYTAFTAGVTFVLVPMGVDFTVAGVRCAKLYGFGELPEQLPARKIAKSALELMTVGVFSIVFAIWYLFIDHGGNLTNYFIQASQYLGGK